jgi:hypothetical protein
MLAGGLVNTGGVVSTVLVISWVTVILLLQASVTENDLVVVSVHPTKSVTSPANATTGTLQLSAASVTNEISGAGTGILQPEITIEGGLDAVGGMLSLTVINCVTVAAFPQASVTVHVRVMVAGQEPVRGESDPTTDPPPLQSFV